MKKIVFYGDGILRPPSGYSEQLIDLLVFHHPLASFQSFHLGEECLTLDSALKNAPFHVIGKAPDLIFLALGNTERLQQEAISLSLEKLHTLIHLFTLKTKAKIVLTSLCSAFYSEASRDDVLAYNVGMQKIALLPQLQWLDLDSAVHTFLEKHRLGMGEKRALHQGPMALTSMGRVFLSQTAYSQLPWDTLLA